MILAHEGLVVRYDGFLTSRGDRLSMLGPDRELNVTDAENGRALTWDGVNGVRDSSYVHGTTLDLLIWGTKHPYALLSFEQSQQASLHQQLAFF